MATTKEKWQEIANRGLQDRFDSETRAKFDEAVRRGLITLPDQASVQQDVQPAQEPTVGQQILGGLENIASIATSAISEPVAGLRGLAAQVAGEDPTQAIESTREALTFQPRTETGKKQQQSIAETLAPVGEAVTSIEKGLGDSVFELTGSPTLAAAATSLPTAVLELLGFKGSKTLTKPSALKTTKKQVQKAIVESAPEVRQLKKVARQVYDEIDNSGVSLKPGSYDRMLENVEQATKKSGLDARVTPRAAGALEVLRDATGRGVNIGEVDTLRKVAQNVAKNIDPTESALGNIIVSEIDDFLDNLKASDINKGTESAAKTGKKFKAARKLWGRARRSELIQEAIEKGEKRASGAENGIRIELDKITRNKKLSKFFPKDELKAINDVVKGDFAQNMTKLVGRFGFSEGRATNVLSALSGVGAGGVVGGGLGAVAVPTIGTVSRSIAQKLTRGKAKFVDSITRAGNDSERIARAYLQTVPKAKRNVNDLADLLSDPNLDLDALDSIANETVKEAKEIARGRRVINLSSAATAGAATSILENEDND